MNRYFFDVYNNEGAVLDQEGQLFMSAEVARAEAMRILCDVARDEISDQAFAKLVVRMRSSAGSLIFEGSLVLTSRWIG
ncbi:MULTISPECIES: hypothetical protein [unclassified Mesorhizobium]|jgi:hypothetical protein|uniref:DUF6894 family protein n=1 Tax=unclassified Mesorhizobium TaxID=325217 RepID=UPI00112C77E3|nr:MULTISPECIES: hypothetical protein [unclassified Mesorhizobium]TPM95027.1 hypothetical protein FJ977_23585 [Mesorhizobium sp. B2-1-3A]